MLRAVVTCLVERISRRLKRVKSGTEINLAHGSANDAKRRALRRQVLHQHVRVLHVGRARTYVLTRLLHLDLLCPSDLLLSRGRARRISHDTARCLVLTGRLVDLRVLLMHLAQLLKLVAVSLLMVLWLVLGSGQKHYHLRRGFANIRV